MPDRNGIWRTISGSTLRSAMQELFVFLEEPFQKELAMEMNTRGINLLGRSSYALTEVEWALHDIFGDYGTKLIMEKLKEILRRHYSKITENQ